MAPKRKQKGKAPSATIQSLPPELISNITDWVELLHSEGVYATAAALQGLGLPEDGDEEGAAALFAALGGLMGAAVGMPGAGQAQGQPGARAFGAGPAAAAPPPAANNPPLNPNAPAFTFGGPPAQGGGLGNAPPVVAPAPGSFTFGAAANAGGATNANVFGFDFSQPPFNRPATSATNPSADDGNNSDDSMPPLEREY